MHIVEAFGRIFISSLFIFEAFKKFSLIIGYKTKISAFAMFIFTIVITIIFHSDFGDQIQLMAFLKNLAIAGGFLIISTNEPKVCTLDYYLKNK